MVFGWFNTKEAAALGDSLAEFFMERIPVDLSVNDKSFTSRASEVIGKMGLQVDRYKAGKKLNLYQKAKLLNVFRWKLEDAGYNKDYVGELVRWLTLKVS